MRTQKPYIHLESEEVNYEVMTAFNAAKVNNGSYPTIVTIRLLGRNYANRWRTHNRRN